MLRFAPAVIVALLALAVASRGFAAHDLAAPAGAASDLELLVVEAEGCIYCRIFRRDVLPSYLASQRAQHVPMRFADFSDVQGGSLALEEPIDSVPTVLLLKAHKEVGRIAGYVGPENFFHALSSLLAGAE